MHLCNQLQHYFGYFKFYNSIVSVSYFQNILGRSHFLCLKTNPWDFTKQFFIFFKRDKQLCTVGCKNMQLYDPSPSSIFTVKSIANKTRASESDETDCTCIGLTHLPYFFQGREGNERPRATRTSIQNPSQGLFMSCLGYFSYHELDTNVGNTTNIVFTN